MAIEVLRTWAQQVAAQKAALAAATYEGDCCKCHAQLRCKGSDGDPRPSPTYSDEGLSGRRSVVVSFYKVEITCPVCGAKVDLPSVHDSEPAPQ